MLFIQLFHEALKHFVDEKGIHNAIVCLQRKKQNSNAKELEDCDEESSEIRSGDQEELKNDDSKVSFNENMPLRMTTRSQTNKLKEDDKENRRLESTKKRLIYKEVYWSNMVEQEAFDCNSDNTDNSCFDQILVYKVETSETTPSSRMCRS